MQLKRKIRDRYDIVRQLGEGGMGVVYEAYDAELERRVALKMLAPELSHNAEATQIFEAEARIMARVRHPHLAAVYDVVRDEDHERTCLVMEYIKGQTLEERIFSDERSFDLEDGVSLSLQLMAALAYLHDQGIVHRDIKPANIMLEEDGALRVMDFGLARNLREIMQKGTRVRGTPAYMAPEQLMGHELSARTDLYAAGITLFEMFAGELPFRGDDLAYHHIHTPAPDVRSRRPDVPAVVAQIISACLQKDPSLRPDSALTIMRDMVTDMPSQSHPWPAAVISALNMRPQLSSSALRHDRSLTSTPHDSREAFALYPEGSPRTTHHHPVPGAALRPPLTNTSPPPTPPTSPDAPPRAASPYDTTNHQLRPIVAGPPRPSASIPASPQEGFNTERPSLPYVELAPSSTRAHPAHLLSQSAPALPSSAEESSHAGLPSALNASHTASQKLRSAALRWAAPLCLTLLAALVGFTAFILNGEAQPGLDDTTPEAASTHTRATTNLSTQAHLSLEGVENGDEPHPPPTPVKADEANLKDKAAQLDTTHVTHERADEARGLERDPLLEESASSGDITISVDDVKAPGKRRHAQRTKHQQGHAFTRRRHRAQRSAAALGRGQGDSRDDTTPEAAKASAAEDSSGSPPSSGLATVTHSTGRAPNAEAPAPSIDEPPGAPSVKAKPAPRAPGSVMGPPGDKAGGTTPARHDDAPTPDPAQPVRPYGF